MSRTRKDKPWSLRHANDPQAYDRHAHDCPHYQGRHTVYRPSWAIPGYKITRANTRRIEIQKMEPAVWHRVVLYRVGPNGLWQRLDETTASTDIIANNFETEVREVFESKTTTTVTFEHQPRESDKIICSIDDPKHGNTYCAKRPLKRSRYRAPDKELRRFDKRSRKGDLTKQLAHRDPDDLVLRYDHRHAPHRGGWWD